MSELITGTETPVPDGPVWELWLNPYEVRWLAATRPRGEQELS